jgi:hypothetical protein
MHSGFVTFDEIILRVKDETGITNLVPYYERIKRMIFQAERQIGYFGSVVRKRIKYTVANNTFNGIQFQVPKDYVEFEGISYENDENYFPAEAFNVNTSYVTLNISQKEKDEIYLTYTGMVCDGLGNPITTMNHEEAVVSYIVWKLYNVKAFLDVGRGSKNYVFQLKMAWEDYRDAARGHDAFPNNWKDFQKLGMLFNSSPLEAMMLPNDNGNNHYETPIASCVLNGYIEIDEVQSGVLIYYWQYDSPSVPASIINSISEDFINLQLFNTLENFNQGILIPYISIGRLGFAIKNATIEEYKILDVLEQDITDIVFDKVYFESFNTTVYVSKEHYSYSNLMFKFLKNE